jgi:coenzyme Q-binding protein COQ10
MPSFRTTRQVRHTAGEMFDLVADVERYPEFVPLCERLKVKRRAEGGEGTQILVADMTVAYGPVRQSFTSQVTLDRARLAILVEYLDGPFSQLENRWRFRPVGEKSSEVDFFISYEFRSKTLGLLMGAAFDKAFRRFAEAFEQRADKIYGVNAPPASL